MRVTLTERRVERFVAGGKGRTGYCWDVATRGLGVRLRADGPAAFVYQYVDAGGRSRRMTLGTVGTVSLDAARDLAREAADLRAAGGDPLRERFAARQAEIDVNALCARYLAEHATKKKPRSAAEDARIIRRHIAPRLGRLPVAAVERADVGALLHSLAATPVLSNRVRALASRLFGFAVEIGVRDGAAANPVVGLRPHREKARSRYLSQEELVRLGVALRAVDDAIAEGRDDAEWPTFPHLVRLLLATGMRKGELLGLRWSDVDLERQVAILRDAKAGGRVVPLSGQALQFLQAVPRNPSNDHVIWGRAPGKPLADAKKPWARLRVAAGLPDVTMHDLRHTAASLAVNSGFALPIVGALLGHRTPTMTARYAHVAAHPAREAAEAVGRILATAFAPADAPGPEAAANVVDIGDAKRRAKKANKGA